MIDVVTKVLAAPVTNTGGHGSSSPAFFFIFGPILIVVGLLNIAKPSWQYRTMRWQFKNPDALAPSDKALVMARIVGGIFVVIGIVMLFAAATR